MESRQIDELTKLEAELKERLSQVVRCWVLDIDENLFEVYLEDNKESRLSASAERDLSKSNEGVIDNPELVPNFFVAQVKAHARKDWQVIFERMVNINFRYFVLNSLDSTPLLNFMFLTNATYKKELFLQQIFEKVYGAELVITINPEFYNLIDQWRVLGEPFNIEFKNFISIKGPFMEFKYNHGEWRRKFQLSDRRQIRLLDDNGTNIDSARIHGFSATHNATNPHTRHPEQTYTKSKDQVFEDLNNDLEKAEKICDLLEKIQALKENKPSRIIPVAIEKNNNKKQIEQPIPGDGISTLRSLYDTDDEDDSPTTSATTSQSSSRSSSPFFKTTAELLAAKQAAMTTYIEMIFSIIDDNMHELEEERTQNQEKLSISLEAIDSIKAIICTACDERGQIKPSTPCEKTIEKLVKQIEIYADLPENDLHSTKKAKELIPIILSTDPIETKNEKLIEILNERLFKLRGRS